MERRGLLKLFLAAPAAGLLALCGGSKPPKVPAVATGAGDFDEPVGYYGWTTSGSDSTCITLHGADGWTSISASGSGTWRFKIQ